MDIRYTLHAEHQIKERKVEKTWIEDTIKSPDEIRRVGNKYYIVKKLNGKRLKVVYVKQSYIKVITVFWI